MQAAAEPAKTPEPEESLVLSASQALRQGTRHILVMGPRGTGKTTFSVSASAHADETIGGKRRVCKDVLVVQGDNEGIMGAIDAGLEPAYVVDMCGVTSWDDERNGKRDPNSYVSRWNRARKALAAKISDGTIKVIVVDLNWPAKLIERAIMPKEIADWGLVATQGQRLFNAFNGFSGVTVIGNSQMKTTVVYGEGTKRGASEMSINTANVKAIGGERSSHTIDLAKGINAMWLDNASFVFARKSNRGKEGPDGRVPRMYHTYTQSTAMYEAKSRAQSVLNTIEPGELSMRTLLKRAYGDAI